MDEELRLGKTVVGVDARQVAGEAAGRNGGHLMTGMALAYHEARGEWGSETARRVYEMTLEEIDRILTQPPTRRTGSLWIADDDDELADIGEELSALRADGFAEAHHYQGPEGEGVLVPSDGVCSPMQRYRDLVPGLDQLSTRPKARIRALQH